MSDKYCRIIVRCPTACLDDASEYEMFNFPNNPTIVVQSTQAEYGQAISRGICEDIAADNAANLRNIGCFVSFQSADSTDPDIVVPSGETPVDDAEEAMDGDSPPTEAEEKPLPKEHIPPTDYPCA